jgi:hypothetical protein
MLILNSERVEGKFVFYVAEANELMDKDTYPVIEFEKDGMVYQFKGPEGTAFEVNEKLPVLLKDNDPGNPKVYTFAMFWLYPMFYALLPLILWSAFALSYVGKHEVVRINIKYPFFKKTDKNPPGDPGYKKLM